MADDALIPPTPTPEDYAREAEAQEAFGVSDDQGEVFTKDDPFALFADWLSLAKEHEINDPNAFSLATVDRDGMPNVRVLLLKDVSENGFTFYSNHQSSKGEELKAAPRAAMAFHWKSIRRQVRIRGDVERVDAKTADAYFASRSRGAQLGAWASQQSREMSDPEILKTRIADYEAIYEGREVKRPDFWGGYRLIPQSIEFWVNRPYRLHDRKRFEKDGEDGWRTCLLYP